MRKAINQTESRVGRHGAARDSAADFRIEQLTRALHIVLRAITGTGTLAMNAKSIARHAIKHHGAKGDLWKLPPNKTYSEP